MQWNLLVIEDDKALSDGIRLALQDAQHRIVQAETLHAGKCCLEKMIETSGRGEQERIDLVILDLNLPDGSGYDFLKTCRSQSDIPVLMLTANDLEINEVIGFELGANDYVTKPFHLAVLRARIQNLLRMTAKEDKSVYEDARFRFDFAKLYYQKDGQTVVLSNTEQKLLKLLVDNQKTTLSRQMLIDRVWTDGAEYVDENALSVAISRLRNKLEDTLSRPMFIQNVYGIGYVWQPAKEKTWRG